MENNEEKKSSGVGLQTVIILQIIFIVLRLLGIITWPLVGVLSPMLVSIVSVIVYAFLTM
jgi:hypothetical protein